jgi:hypothetical protein
MKKPFLFRKKKTLGKRKNMNNNIHYLGKKGYRKEAKAFRYEVSGYRYGFSVCGGI